MRKYEPSKKESWKRLSKEINGKYFEDELLKPSKVKARIDNWIIILDTYTESTGRTRSTYTRIRAPFINEDGFNFKVYRGNSGLLGNLFGKANCKTGFTDFDNNYVVRSNDELKVKELFSNDKVRKLLEDNPDISLHVTESEEFYGLPFPETIDEIHFSVSDIITDVDKLKGIFQLFYEVLKTLSSIGSAKRIKPSIEAHLV